MNRRALLGAVAGSAIAAVTLVPHVGFAQGGVENPAIEDAQAGDHGPARDRPDSDIADPFPDRPDEVGIDTR